MEFCRCGCKFFFVNLTTWVLIRFIQSQIQAFVTDASGALSRSLAFDSKVLSAASGISSQYADVVSLATRQVFGGLEVTVSRQ
jgi:hypothetical protein